MLKKICLLFVVVFAFIYFYRPIGTSDTGWHIATGRWILTHHQVPREDPFSMTSQPVHWIFTQWLGSTLLSVPYLWGGVQGLKIFRALVFFSTVILFLFYARHKVSPPLWLITSTLMIYGLATRCAARSFIFNFIFISAILMILFSFQKTKSVKPLYLLPALALVWGNIHMGSFVYGVIILSTFLMAMIFKTWKEYRRETNETLQKDLKTSLLHVMTVCFLYFLWVGITPYGLEGFLYPYRIFLEPSYMHFYDNTFPVAENLPPLYLFSWSGLWFMGLLVLTVTSLIVGKAQNYFALLLFFASLLLFLGFSRGSDFFTLACCYIIVEQFHSGIKPGLPFFSSERNRLSQSIYLILILVIGIQMVRVTGENVYLHGQQRRLISLDYVFRHPKDSVEFLKKLKIEGNVFCNEHTGSYIVGDAYPGLKPFIDGRNIHFRDIEDYLDVTSDPTKKWESIEEKHQFHIVLLDGAIPISWPLIRYLNQNGNWQLIHVDQTFVTFVKKNVFPLPPETDSVQNNLKTTQATEQEKSALQQLTMAPMPEKRFWLWDRSETLLDILDEATTLTKLGYREAGIKKFAQSMAISPTTTKRALPPEN